MNDSNPPSLFSVRLMAGTDTPAWIANASNDNPAAVRASFNSAPNVVTPEPSKLLKMTEKPFCF